MKRGTEQKADKETKAKRINAALNHRGKWRQGKGQMAYFKLGAWNVRTMLWKLRLKKGQVHVEGQGLGKEQMLCDELERKGIALCALSEVRWKDKGEYQFGEYLFLYSGRGDDLSQEGVAIVLNPVMTKAWKESGKQVNYASSRVMSINFGLGNDNYRVIAVYAPTFKAEDAAKDMFSNSVSTELCKAARSDTVICLGDWNARVGTSDETWQEVLGPYGNPERNENGLRLLEMCTTHRLRVMNTFFKHKHYDTWYHNRYKTWHTLDHILVSQNCQKKVLDVKVRLDANWDTDHRLVEAKIRPNKRRHNARGMQNIIKRQPRLDTSKLKDPAVKASFHEETHKEIKETMNRKGLTYERKVNGTSNTLESIHIYTDGGCTLNEDNNEKTPAGWGVHINQANQITEIWGPVITKHTDKHYIGAQMGSKNTGELNAICEALLWVL